jgi:tRNA pseudouridine55 synthase
VTVHSIRCLHLEGDQAEIQVRCSAGTYVRALARDLGQSLGLGAHLVALRRLGAGGFDLEQAVPWERLAVDARNAVIPLSGLLGHWPEARVGAEGRAFLRHGRDLPHALVLSGFPGPGQDTLQFRVLDEEGQLLAIASPRGADLSPAAPAVQPVLHPDIVFLDDPSA